MQGQAGTRALQKLDPEAASEGTILSSGDFSSILAPGELGGPRTPAGDQYPRAVGAAKKNFFSQPVATAPHTMRQWD